jgi:hypothetical protein
MNAPTDTEMLDWLDKQDGGIGALGYGDYTHYFTPSGDWSKTARETIKDAMQEEATK